MMHYQSITFDTKLFGSKTFSIYVYYIQYWYEAISNILSIFLIAVQFLSLIKYINIRI